MLDYEVVPLCRTDHERSLSYLYRCIALRVILFLALQSCLKEGSNSIYKACCSIVLAVRGNGTLNILHVIIPNLSSLI